MSNRQTPNSSEQPIQPLDQLLNNGERLFAKGHLGEAWQQFEQVLKQDPENRLALNNLGVLSFETYQLDKAKHFFSDALKADPNFEQCRTNLQTLTDTLATKPEARHLKGKRLALLGEPEALAQTQNYFGPQNETKILDPSDPAGLSDTLKWADLVWCDRCDRQLAVLSRLNTTTPLLARVRDYDLERLDILQQIKWSRLEGLVFDTDQTRQTLNETFGPELTQQQQIVVPDSVDLQQCPVRPNTAGLHLAYLGPLAFGPALILLVQCLRQAVGRDKGYRLHLYGQFESRHAASYFNHQAVTMNLRDHVVFHGPIKSVSEQLHGINYVVTTNPFGGCTAALAQALAGGIKPLIHDGPGAAELFERQLRFSSPKQFVARLRADNYDSFAYRRLAAGLFNAAINLPLIDILLSRMVPATSSRTTTTLKRPAEPATTTEPATGVDFVQQLPEDVGYVDDRKRFTVDFCRGKRVLHVGCVDVGMMTTRQSEKLFLHELIAEVATELIGVDIDEHGLKRLAESGFEVHRLDLESDLELLRQLTGRVDVVVIPEVIEHLSNPGRALDNLRQTGFTGDILITTPSAFSHRIQTVIAQGVELIHPDHNYWFSPTTLTTLLGKHGLTIKRLLMYYYPGTDQIGVEHDAMMRKSPYYGDGLLAVTRLAAEGE